MRVLPFLSAASLAATSTVSPPFRFALPTQSPSAELWPPVRLEAGGKPIDTEEGHAAPFVGDFDGDGTRDLLVGQYGEGKLWIFHNSGTNAKPVLDAGKLFKEGSPDGRVPSG
jgi:hypothetical protein